MASALAETRAGRRRATSGERKPLRRPKPEVMAAAAARTAAIEGTTAQGRVTDCVSRIKKNFFTFEVRRHEFNPLFTAEL